MKPRSTSGKVRSPSALVAKAPHHHRRVILVALYHSAHAVNVGGCPCWVACQSSAQSVSLQISLVEDVESDTVAQLVPSWSIGIMTCSHSVDISLLHQSDVLKHSFFGHHPAEFRVVLMTVYAAHLYRATIYEEQPVANLYCTEAHVLQNLLNDLPFRINQSKAQFVQIRSLGRPSVWLLNLHLHSAPLSVASLRIPLVHTRSLVFEVEHIGNANRISSDCSAVISKDSCKAI